MTQAATFVRYEQPTPRVARIVLARPEKKNAQNNKLLYELNDAFDRAARDNEVRVIILAADGTDFSAGHDLPVDISLQDVKPISTWGSGQPGIEGHWAYEEEAYFGLCWRWRNIPKPTICAVQGRAIAAGLMLVWVCDLIVASEDALFSDPVVAFGANGVEYFAHPFELGVRKAKELLFTGRQFTARSLEKLGMINRVVPRASLEAETLALAEEIAQRPPMGLKLAKLAINQSQDAQGFYTALRGAMSIQQLSHSHAMNMYGEITHPDAGPLIRKAMKELPPL